MRQEMGDEFFTGLPDRGRVIETRFPTGDTHLMFLGCYRRRSDRQKEFHDVLLPWRRRLSLLFLGNLEGHLTSVRGKDGL